MSNSHEGDSVFLAEFLVIRILMTVTVVFFGRVSCFQNSYDGDSRFFGRVFAKPISLNGDSHRIAHKNVKVQLNKMLIKSMSPSEEFDIQKTLPKKKFAITRPPRI